MIRDILTSNYAAAIGIIFMVIFLLSNSFLDKKIRNTFFLLITLETVEAVAYSLELWTATFSYYTWWRTLLSAIGYSVRPIITFLLLQIALRNHAKFQKQKMMWALPMLLNIVAAFSAFFTDAVYSYTSDNLFVRGPLGYFTLLVLVFYILCIVAFSVKNSQGMNKSETTIVFAVAFLSVSAMIVEIVYSARNINRTTMVLSTVFYCMFFFSYIYQRDIKKSNQKLEEKELEATQLFAAIRATYDMVVAVNLTQNSYKYIGNESFAIHGDATEGVFDDIINIHASKVATQHRKLYYETFSRKALLDAYAAGKKSVYLEYQQYDDSGVPHWLATRTMFTVQPDSTDVTEITISRNIDEQISARKQIGELNRLSLTDALTGARNRYAMYQHFDAHKDTEKIGIVFCDITGLKATNDTKGHSAGDELIQNTYKCLLAGFDEQDVFRVGGDEFVVICHIETEDKLQRQIGVVRNAIQEKEIFVAIGYEWRSRLAETIQQTIKAAETQMYAEKSAWYQAAGKNR